MRFGIVGAGGIVNFFLNMSKEIEEIELEAICSLPQDENKLIQLSKEHGINNYYTDLDAMLNSGTIDMVYIGVPNHVHYIYTKKALEADLNVVCEKPFTSNYDETKELIDIAVKNKLYLFEAVTTRYFPNTIKIKEDLNKLGDIKIVALNYSQYSSRYDVFKQGENIAAFDPKASGGALMDLNIYNINFVVFLFGKPLSVEYLANMERGIDTSGILTLDYGKFKCVCIAAKDSKAPISATIQGDKGCINVETSVNVLNEYKLSLNDKDSKNRYTVDDATTYNFNKEKNMMYYEFVEFIKIINSKNYEKVREMLEITLITMEIQTKARKQAGIIFHADEN